MGLPEGGSSVASRPSTGAPKRGAKANSQQTSFAPAMRPGPVLELRGENRESNVEGDCQPYRARARARFAATAATAGHAAVGELCVPEIGLAQADHLGQHRRAVPL